MLPLPLCRIASGWNESKFKFTERYADPEPDNNDATESKHAFTRSITAAVNNRTFWCYARFINTLAGAIDIESSWAEGCSCHQSELTEHRWFSSRKKAVSKKLHAEAGSESEPHKSVLQTSEATCKLKGRRAHEYACGEYDSFVNHVLRLAKQHVHVVCMELRDADRAMIYSDFQAATDVITTQTSLRSSFWKCLPWKLAGLGAESSEEARKCARECRDLYNASMVSASNSSYVHPITQRFFSPAPCLFHSENVSLLNF